ncbi:hypothetical protein [Salibacterium halotolerans]|uniref:Uncharacterized protein n=1 Tax=Salibacterium halotolerans TaxID=1884432 RepID=A0A1I5MKI4_9BACI|nr:hypothetical protein [Salibacterium halotolerans]SFP10033.1 hypothetical protein SAMN05518683_102266 [Salibacterium halotolerans]
MTARSFLNGHPIEHNGTGWVYSDTKESTVVSKEQGCKEYVKRKCGHCGQKETAEGHDGCLGTLIGVMNACCGHGKEKGAYVQFWNRESVRGRKAIEIMKILKKHS